MTKSASQSICNPNVPHVHNISGSPGAAVQKWFKHVQAASLVVLQRIVDLSRLQKSLLLALSAFGESGSFWEGPGRTA